MGQSVIPSDTYIGEKVDRSYVEKSVAELLVPRERLLGAFHALKVTGVTIFTERWKTESYVVHSYLLVTDRRVIFWGRGAVKRHVESFHYKDILAVEHTQRLMRRGELVLRGPGPFGGAKRFCGMPDAVKATEMIRERVANAHQADTQTQGSPTIPEQIAQLAQLRKTGVLTEEEFNWKKAELLGRL